MGAGEYSERLTWKQQSTVKDVNTGQDVETWTDNGFLWACVETNTGRRRRDYGGRETGQDVTIRVRNWPALSALDRLYWNAFDVLYVIDSIGIGDNELICTCFSYDTLEI